MSDELTEFTWIEPEEVHLVGAAANGFPAPLLAKAVQALDDVLDDSPYSGDGLVKYVSAAERRKYAKSGVAMSTGAFPIPDEGHLRSAIGRLAEYQGDKAKAKAHIIKRGRALGLVHLLPKDWHVSKDTEKETAPEKGVPRDEADAQTDEHLEGDPDTGVPPEAHDGGQASPPSETLHESSRATGQGDTAPDKTLPVSAATHAQTDDAQKDAIDMTGDSAPDGEAPITEAEHEAAEETAETHDAEKNAADSDPGSSAWEHKDVALGENAERLVSQLAQVVHTFTQREKAEGGASKSARNLTAALKYLNHKNQIPLLKELAEMSDTNELAKALDELGKARRDAKKEAEKARKAKAAKREEKAAKAAKKAAKAAGEPAADKRLTKALEEFASMKETVEKIASEDGKRVVLNEAGVVAVLRDPQTAPAVFKGLEDAVVVAEASLEKARAAAPRDAEGAVLTTAATMRAEAELRQARARRDTAKMIAGENARSADPVMLQRRLDGRGVPLFNNRHSLPEDSDLKYIEGRRLQPQ